MAVAAVLADKIETTRTLPQNLIDTPRLFSLTAIEWREMQQNLEIFIRANCFVSDGSVARFAPYPVDQL